MFVLIGICFEELEVVIVELVMEGWVDVLEIVVVDWEINFCLCCNWYFVSWLVKVIGVDWFVLNISGEFLLGLVFDVLSGILLLEILSILNLFWIFMGFLFLLIFVYFWELDKVCDCFWKWEVMLFWRLIILVVILLVVISNVVWEFFRLFVFGNFWDWVWRWEVMLLCSVVNLFVILLFVVSKVVWEVFRLISLLNIFFNNNDNWINWLL